MPSKSKRAATRQAKLSQRRRRSRKQRTGEQPAERVTAAHAAPAASSRRRATSTVTATAAQTQTQTLSGAAPAPQTSQRRTRSVAAAPRARTRASQDRAATYEPLPMYAYLGSEIKRIGVISAAMAVALAALTMVLGQT